MSSNFQEYLRGNRLEHMLFIILVLEMVMSWLLDFSITRLLLSFTGIENHDHVFILFLHVWLLFIVGIELGKATSRSTIWKISPPILFILSFVVLIIIGSSLLMLPEMSADKQGMSFIDALFTSISANCVTGLIVVDTATFFSLKGKVLILLLIQFGGLNIIAFATYFISFFRKSVEGHRNRTTIKELLQTDSLDSTKNMVKMVVFTTLIIEFIGTVILYHQWDPQVGFSDNSEKLFYSVFHAISAFNNAGFTLFTDGFASAIVQSTFTLHITVALLIVLGGLGFTTIQDTFSLFRHRFRTKLPVQSKIAWLSTILLVFVGAAVFFIAENGNTLGKQDFSEAITTSFFQSVTARTAGFNTVSFSNLTPIVIVATMILMFIGASSGSTGGGIKTSTFTVLLLAIVKRKEKAIDYGTSFLTGVLVKKAVTILLYSFGVIVVSVIILIIVEPDKTIVQLCFEEISAFGTVGLSTGITPELSTVGKSVIMASMFIGRIGPLALAYALIKSITVSKIKEEKGIMLG
tara:strand:+ start:3012 stop:4574 length:1563 start_codon:yes stop_codon:yes gene_type:complete